MIFILLLTLFPFCLCAEKIPRQVIGFWDSAVDSIIEDGLIHRTLEMPLNYLGIDVLYHDIQSPLPDISQRDDVLGFVVCFQEGTKMKDPKAFLEWAVNAVDHRKKAVLMRNLGFLSNDKGDFTPGSLQNRLFEKLGFNTTQQWIEYPFDYQVISTNTEMYPFELPAPTPLPGFYINKSISPDAKSYLKAAIPGKPDSESDLIIIGPNGAYVSEFFSNNFDNLSFSSSPKSLGWYINPFLFLNLVFHTENHPIPDPTTLAGRRIFFSTCHGDSWNSETSIEELVGKNIFCSEVLLEQVIAPHPELPVAVAIIAADIDPTWAGRSKSASIAKKYFSLPQVEAASHTYSHPFFWNFFRTGGPEKEIDYLHLYPYGSWQNSFLSWLRSRTTRFFSSKAQKTTLKWGYAIPRAYANEPFNLDKEISGAQEYLNRFAPPYNKIKLLIWPGDSRPWDSVFKLCETAGLKNQGGGFVRFDPEYPSNLFVYPNGRKPGGFIQIYSCANADNGYTYGWKGDFYRFKFLPATLKNTETPRRLKPIHLYYHSYSGQFQASVDALIENIAFIKSQPIIPIRVGRFCEIGTGFYTTVIDEIGDRKWKISNRQGLQTLRVDKADMQVDFAASYGIIGWRRHQGSLYISLDASADEPIITLKPLEETVEIPFLVESSWEIWNLKRQGSSFSFNAKGWGTLAMQWKVPQDGMYSVSASTKAGNSLKVLSKNRELVIEMELPFDTLAQINIEPVRQ